MEEQLKALKQIRSICSGFKSPKMSDNAELAWAIYMCREISDQFIRMDYWNKKVV
jgi:hypothetical protein